MATAIVTIRRRGTWTAVATIALRTARNVLTTGFTSAKGTWRAAPDRADAASRGLEVARPAVMSVMAII
jgi:hypothetical protein